MKPMIFVPPAQAEALCDAQDEGRDDLCLADLCRPERTIFQPWRDDESADDSAPRLPASQSSLPNAQLWPSSANSSR